MATKKKKARVTRAFFAAGLLVGRLLSDGKGAIYFCCLDSVGR
jgi:hypothetical protein